MGKVTSVFVRKVIQQVDNTVGRNELLLSVGLDPDAEPDPAVMISDEDHYAILERIVRAEPNGSSLPLRVGQSMECDDYGAFGLAWKSAPTLRGSYERAVRYALVLTSVSHYEIEDACNDTYMHLRRDGVRRLGLRLSNEITLASIVSISRQVSSEPFSPKAVFIKHAAPADISDHEQYFGCPVHFNADRDALLVSKLSLDVPNILGDEMMSRFFQTHLDADLARLEDNEALDGRVRLEVTKRLSEGLPELTTIAGELGMSARTLQRRLAEMGYSFQELVDDARRELSQTLLQETDYSLVDIAFLTGFSGQSGFNRAFKRWSGQTPRSYRLQSL
ncbi:MAG: AraC family transcriptional regulator [Alphaproteobacteria bacterium]|nr:AraC family transcriptional regulator [Alphaproteobacteria bacterium]